MEIRNVSGSTNAVCIYSQKLFPNKETKEGRKRPLHSIQYVYMYNTAGLVLHKWTCKGKRDKVDLIEEGAEFAYKGNFRTDLRCKRVPWRFTLLSPPSRIYN